MRVGELKIEKKKVMDFITNNCSEALRAQPIYRGAGTRKEVMLIDTSDLPARPAANTSNYCNLIMQQMDSWTNNFPRRSTICTTSIEYASMYGEVYRVLPVDGTVIGICPGKDFWMFPRLKSESKNITGSSSLPSNIKTINMELADIADICKVNLDERNPEVLVSQLAQISKLWARKYMIRKVLGTVLNSEKSLVKRLEYLLDPVANNFFTVSLDSFNGLHEREVWFDNKAILVNLKVLKTYGL